MKNIWKLLQCRNGGFTLNSSVGGERFGDIRLAIFKRVWFPIHQGTGA
jgi:hypothetical protein